MSLRMAAAQWESAHASFRPYSQFKEKTERLLDQGRRNGMSQQQQQAIRESLKFAAEIRTVDYQFLALFRVVTQAIRQGKKAANDHRRAFFLEPMFAGRQTLTTW